MNREAMLIIWGMAILVGVSYLIRTNINGEVINLAVVQVVLGVLGLWRESTIQKGKNS
ncbi:hypothetical protein [Thiothrix nivea]|uniref:hypothetical protein n=1 Tax=Thiothrix nivea TaxID=1031 RepID=UPI0012B6A57B|nr:hypothetical protein [Thiothrix nivea]